MSTTKPSIPKGTRDFTSCVIRQCFYSIYLGFESGGQKLWLEYISPYIDEHFVDTYGTYI